MPDARRFPRLETAAAAAPALTEARPLIAGPTPGAVTPIHVLPARRRNREVSVVGLLPAEKERLERHNAGIGTSAQRTMMRFVFLWLLGPLGSLALRLLFRIRPENLDRLRILARSSGLFAIRHFYEVDPFVSFYAAAYRLALTHRHMVSYSLASRAWTKNRLMRAISWSLGVMGLSRGLGLQQSATERAVELLSGDRLACAAIYPTGPIGSRRTFSLAPGVGFIATRCPDVPVIPVTLTGMQEFTWRDILLLRRPVVHVAICRPFYGRDVAGAGGDEQCADRICDLIAERWAEEEQRIAGENGVGGTRG